MTRRASHLRLDFPPELPISARAEEITAAVQRHQVLILSGETGSGKTTQIPKMCLAAGRGTAGRIACTQPRRVAALSISRRVAAELGVAWGREVGCKIRFTDQTSPETVIKFVTDGMLLAELQGDPLLREYDTIMLDEAHERSLNIDFLLGHLRQLRFRRPELRLIITSATIDTAAFAKAFDDAPVIEVSGRLYPVEVIYAPLDELGTDAAAGDEPAAKAEALHYIDGAVEAVERIRRESPAGDILVFMPAERDIRETCDLLEGRHLAHTEVIPLFGRLTNAEQQRVFAPTAQRRIIVATNIAETSLTIPGIRFVVDTGLARISRYAPQARTRRLPIEPIAQSSADQRKGRCGRVADGVCIRLYSEPDFLARPRFTQPEIQRCNLADVILRMKVFGLGDIERFPFLNAPPAKAVSAGYQLLEELGALEPAAGTADPGHNLTTIGRELARLPVDPTVGRMILQARAEKCLREVLVIAAGLSIQDPRERPLDRQAQADAAHRRFAQPDSDFLTLLNIWEAFHAEFEAMAQSRLRRFCHEHFLSYIRLREWRDIHDQLVEVLAERDDFRLTSVRDGLPPERNSKRPSAKLQTRGAKLAFGSPGYRAIHRSILAGLLGNIAVFDEQSGRYQAAHDRKVTLFPGSVLFRREEPRRKSSSAEASASARATAERPEGSAADGKRPPRWIMAAEIVETTRLYARTAARIDPAWALDLGAHLLKVSHTDPFWSAEAGRVMVHRRARLHGLELESRAVGYGQVDPIRATEIFIREGLVAETITWPFDFLAHNRRVREKIATILTRTRSSGYLDLDEAVYRFYAARLLPAGAATPPSPTMRDEGVAPPAAGVSSVPDLLDLVRLRRQTEPKFLQLEPEDLRGAAEAAQDMAAFPDMLPLENRVLPLDYVYRPGGEEDGVTLTVRVCDATNLTAAALDWAVPGHLEEKVLHLLKALPTGQRRVLIPLAETAKTAARAVAQRARLRGHQDPLAETLAAYLREAHRLAVDLRAWAAKPLPDHLRVRVQVVDEQGRPLVASRDVAEVRRQLEGRLRELSAGAAREDPTAWRRARARWEQEGQTTWTFGEIPERVSVGDRAGVPVYAYPALVTEDAGVALRLRRSPEEAQADLRRGLFHLFELELRYELAWLQRDLRDLRAVGVLAATLASVEQLQEQALVTLRRWACGRPVAPLTAAAFARAVGQARADLRGVVPRLTDLLREIFTLRQALLTHPQPYPGLEADLATLLPPDFIAATPFPQLAHLPRYLKAMQMRADRWRENPTRDAERAKRLAPYPQAAAALRRAAAPTVAADRFRWLVEEYRVSLFAQELGTAGPVSPVRLDRELQALRRAAGSAAEANAAAAGKPAAPAPVAAPAATGPLKNLGALDRLFPRG
jgi:ATP-dependent helicase HrpA